YRDRLEYAVVGDIGPREIIGEASYAAARRLGIPAHPSTGGVGSGVTYIVFKNSRIDAIEDHAAAVATGERLARRLVNRETGRENDGAARENSGAAQENAQGNGETARENDGAAQGDGQKPRESDGTAQER